MNQADIHPFECRPQATGARTPRLSINLLGGMELMLDGKPYDNPFLHRQKVKTLMALLVISEGREVNTEHLQSVLWPRSALSKNRNNFNNLWSLMRKGLTPEGSTICPYVRRHQGVCKIDRDLVDSDIFQLHELCDEFQFAEAEPAQALRLYHQLLDIYRGDLMPGEHENLSILRSRRLWLNRTVDALYMMALSLKRRGALLETIWFTQSALGIDATREDVLRLEMRAHLDQGNPSRALAAYMQAGTVLEERYGLQPHAETVALASEALGGALPPRFPMVAHIPVEEPSGKRKKSRRKKKAQPAPESAPEEEAVLALAPAPLEGALLATGDIPQRSAR